ncbi:uncharacterized protein F4807DRAFT_303704 [Annulohypoxylon truncatum]|uniref:uncharacterized protein n=1 Tax=Annulohypoxylon truncatum TaxID=327061 RepID=UPI002008D254|nr:uncharacterized protein F4807DRAFT_303704 [Annulohypoxylon truncatum]KAI1212887.1 hypothetical protein F4807DRAFT_303704 [Annulohypoxylon truncatum]
MEAPESAEVPTQCEKVGEAMPDIAGYGVLLGLSIQAFISLVLSFWVFFLTKLGRLDSQHPEGTPEHASQKKRLGFVSEILMTGNDLQMITGIALIITAVSNAKSIDLYHLHLVFDTVSFVGISNAAALICWTIMRAKAPKKKHHQIVPSHWTGRFRVSYMFAVLFLVMTVFLEIRLDGWSLTSEDLGRCYITTGIAGPNANHPGSDKTYVAITATWLLLVMFGALFAPARFAKPLLILSFLQFPVHMYMMIRLRTENQDALENRENENDWDFGQTTATLLLAVAITQLIHQAVQYLKFEKALKKYGPEYALANENDECLDAGTPSIVEQGIKGLRDVHQNLSKRNLSETRPDRGDDIERQEESYELMRNSEGRNRTSL